MPTNANNIETDIAIGLDLDGSLKEILYKKQTGISENNRHLADAVKACVMSAARTASPYLGLNPDDYDSWKNITLRLRVME